MDCGWNSALEGLIRVGVMVGGTTALDAGRDQKIMGEGRIEDLIVCEG